MWNIIAEFAWPLSTIQIVVGFGFSIIRTWVISEEQYSKETDLLRKGIIDRISQGRNKTIAEYLEAEQQAKLGPTEKVFDFPIESGRRVAWEMDSMRRLFQIEKDVDLIEIWHHLFLTNGIIALIGLVLAITVDSIRPWIAIFIVLTLTITIVGAISVRKKQSRLNRTKRFLYRGGDDNVNN